MELRKRYCWTFGILFAGILAGLIAVSILLARKTGEELDRAKLTTARHGPFTLHTRATLSPASSESAPIYRLPTTVQPRHYELFLQIHLPYDEDDTLPDALTTRGSHVNITLRTTAQGVRNITFHARHEVKENSVSGYIKQFDKDAVSLLEFTGNGTVDGVFKIVSVDFLKVDIVVVHLDRALLPDRDYKLRIQFEGVIGQNMQGLYRSQFVKDGKTRYLVTSQFEPIMARMAFPCFDEPGIRSRFSTTLKYPNRFTMIRTNGQAEGEAITDGLWLIQKYTTTPAMPVYLNAFLVSDFELTSVDAQDPSEEIYPFNVIARKEFIDRGDAAYALQQGKVMMEFLSREFNQSYIEHLPKLDMAAVPDFNVGAMENWGLILYREARLLYRPKVSTAEQKSGVAGIIAHELAHMLFGNVVTCSWWSNIWLNEGFATYLMYMLMGQANPSWNTKYLFSYWVIHDAFQHDSYLSTHPLYDPRVENNTLIDNSFDPIAYAKGASVIHMLKGVLGEIGFNRVLKEYIRANKLGSVEHGDFLREVEIVALEMGFPAGTMSRYLRSWIEESGYPVLMLDRGSGTDPSEITYTQQIFRYPTLQDNDSINNSTVEPTLWDIPLTLTNGAPGAPLEQETAKHGCFLSKAAGSLRSECESEVLDYPTLPASDERIDNFIIANVQQYGFYRVNYDRHNWNRIIMALPVFLDYPTVTPSSVLKNNVIRGQLIDDSFNLARAGFLSYEVPLKLIHNYFTLETHHGPLASARDNFRHLYVMLEGTVHHDLFVEYMRKLMEGGLYTNSRWSNSWTDADVPSHGDSEGSFNRVMANNIIINLSCYFEVAACVTSAVTRFRRWRESGIGFGPDTRTNNDIQTKEHMLCYGVRHGPVENWHYLRGLYDHPEATTSDQRTILRALACTKYEELVERVLAMVLDGKSVRPQDQSAAFAALGRWVGRRTWDFLRSGWSKLTGSTSTIMADLSRYVKTERHLAQIQQLYVDVGGKDGSDSTAFEKAIEQAQVNVAWMAAHADEVGGILKTLTIGEPTPLLL
ncbi:Aminopeptidase N [Hypsibius exemplaris]|uniref:Aminopeptidase N n=1 Tax=Hypsibius exemplaris TaxID=2072580 RepID=A0A9X6RMF3_HYPEX|nr:Aminopeptidase N [Hypsibius exemplaris]